MAVCVFGAGISFFMPWVTCDYGIKMVALPSGKFQFSDTLIFISAKYIFRNAVKKNSVFVSYAGYRLPDVIWRARKNVLGKSVLKLSKLKNVHIYSFLLYLYPVLLVIFLWLMRRYKKIFWIRYLVIAGTASVVWGQLCYAGLYDTSSTFFLIFLDYGFWSGLLFYILFCVLVWRKYKW